VVVSEIIAGPAFAGSVAAAEFGSGAGGLLVVVLLGAVSIGLFAALSGSLKRMRANVNAGRFGANPPRDEDRDTGQDGDVRDQPRT
jgi:hypothetical protein